MADRVETVYLNHDRTKFRKSFRRRLKNTESSMCHVCLSVQTKRPFDSRNEETEGSWVATNEYLVGDILTIEVSHRMRGFDNYPRVLFSVLFCDEEIRTPASVDVRTFEKNIVPVAGG